MEESAAQVSAEKESAARKKMESILLFAEIVSAAKIRTGATVSLVTRNNKSFDVTIQHVGSESILLGLSNSTKLDSAGPSYTKDDVKAAGFVMVKKVKGEYAVLQIISVTDRGVLCCPHPRNSADATYNVAYEKILGYWDDLETAKDACASRIDVTFYEMTVPGESCGYMFS